jgi:hypothetical protein
MTKYQRRSRGGRFQNRGEGLRTSVDRIRQQRQTEIDAMKLQAGQADAINKLQISGLKNVAKVESENRGMLQKLENEIYTKKRNAITVRSDREVESILGEAKELGKEAAWWEKFASTHSKEIAKGAKGLVEYAQYRQAINLAETRNPNEQEELGQLMQDMYFTVYGDAVNAAEGLKDFKESKDVIISAQANAFYWEIINKEHYDNLNSFVEFVKRSAPGEFNHQTAQQHGLNATYLKMKQHGIPFESKQGRAMIAASKRAFGAVAERMQSKVRFDEDQKDIDYNAQVFAAIMPRLIDRLETAEDGGNKELAKKLREEIQLIQRGFHKVVNGSYQDLGGGKYGIVPRNPKQLNMEIISETYKHLANRFMSPEDAITFYDTIHTFNPKDGSTLIENGSPVGIVTKSKDVEKHIFDTVESDQKEKKRQRLLREQGNRIRKIKPYQDIWEEAKKTGDYSKLDDAWHDGLLNALITAEMNGTDEQKQAFKWLEYDKGLHGDLTKFLQIKSDFESGDINEALTGMAQLGDVPEGYSNMHKTAALIMELPEEGKTITKRAKDLIDSVHESGLIPGLKDYGSITQVDIMRKIATSRIINLMMADTSDLSADAKFEKASQQVEKEIEQGKNGTGLFAMTKASEARFIPAEYKDGKRVKDAYYADDQIDSNAKGYHFLAADDFIESGNNVSIDVIEDTFFTVRVYPDGDVRAFGTDQLQRNLSTNLNSTKSILSSDQKRNIIQSALRGKYDDRSIPDNLRLLIAKAKMLDSSLTTKNVMDMVINATTEGDEYKSYSDVRWSANHEDLTKKLVGSCTDNPQKNVAMCMAQRAKALNLDINEEIIKMLQRRSR